MVFLLPVVVRLQLARPQIAPRAGLLYELGDS